MSSALAAILAIDDFISQSGTSQASKKLLCSSNIKIFFRIFEFEKYPSKYQIIDVYINYEIEISIYNSFKF